MSAVAVATPGGGDASATIDDKSITENQTIEGHKVDG